MADFLALYRREYIFSNEKIEYDYIFSNEKMMGNHIFLMENLDALDCMDIKRAGFKPAPTEFQVAFILRRKRLPENL